MKKHCIFAALLPLSLSLCFLTSCGEQIHTVQFYIGHYHVDTVFQVKHGDKVREPRAELLPKGYVINGWDVEVGSLRGRWSFDECRVYSDLRLYADYEGVTYNVTLIGKDDSQSKVVQVTYDSEYDFSSFYDYSGYFNCGKPSYLTDGHSIFMLEGVWRFANDVVLYPFWSSETVSYRFMELVYPLSAQEEPVDGKTTLLLWSEHLVDVQNDNSGYVSGTAKEIAANYPLKEPYKEGYRFEGWYRLDDFEYDFDGQVTASASAAASVYDGCFDDLYGLFSKTSSFTLSSYNKSRGQVEFLNGEVTKAYYNDKIAIRAVPKEGYLFGGWYLDGKKISTDPEYVFSMPHRDCVLYAGFVTEREALGMDPCVYVGKTLLTYGLYPQSRVSDKATIASLNSLTSAESNGWYLLDGEYYAKKEAEPYSSSYAFDDGATIVSGTTYWFKCDPIEWKILSSESGEYSLVSAALLDAHDYDSSTSNRTIDGKTVYQNNYEHSGIREWLNGDFYDSAFSLGGSCVLTTTVDNSASTTGSSSNPYACGNTQDKVYLLSYKDYENSDYFADAAARRCKTTDWARASGAYCDTDYNGWCWTRSPYSSYSDYAWYVNYGAALYYRSVHLSGSSVRPSLRIKAAQ